MNTPEWEALRAFRQQGYPLFGGRRDALFEMLDTVLSAPHLETPAHLSLSPNCQRRWDSLYDALNAGTMNLTHRERLVAFYPLEGQVAWFAVDASVWPRCDAETSQIGVTTITRTAIPSAGGSNPPIATKSRSRRTWRQLAVSTSAVPQEHGSRVSAARGLKATVPPKRFPVHRAVAH